jgi:hypothetical protein
MEALDKRGVDLPPSFGQHLLHRLQHAEHDLVLDPNDASPAVGLDDLRIEEFRPWHPAGFGPRPFALTPLGWHPLTVMRDERSEILPKAIRQKQRGTVRREYLGDLMHEALGQGKRAVTHVDGQDQLGDGVHATQTP